mmetsp:Transcript_22776/g.34516  ORF Transcript_22776/g.34516 Transcript_22776/m.34516 type:complete len:316 (-) Transcript_22776:118-1065(-)
MANNQQSQTNRQQSQADYVCQRHPQHTSALCPPPPHFNPYPTWGQTVVGNQPPTKRPRLNYFCEICDITVESQAALKAHTDSHITCSHCEYIASPKLVKAHNQSVHGKFSRSGFKTVTVAIPGCPVRRYRICVGNNPEDVRKWISERRKNFPRSPNSTLKTSPSGAFNSLLDGYGSSSSENDDEGSKEKAQAQQENDERPTKDSVASSSRDNKHAPSFDNNSPTRLCRFFARNGKCRKGNSCSFLHESLTSDRVDISRSNHRLTSRRKTASTSSSLLQKLLRTDAQRESYLTIQLLKYLVNCNFLQEQRLSEKKL